MNHPIIWSHPDIDGQYISASSKNDAMLLFKAITGKEVDETKFVDTNMLGFKTRVMSTEQSLEENLYKDNNDLEIIGYSPIYKPKRGQIVTRAFILCSNCNSVISTSGGPRYDSVCLKCISIQKK